MGRGAVIGGAEMKGEERRREYVGLRKAPRCFSMQLICILINEQETNQLIQFCLSVSQSVYVCVRARVCVSVRALPTPTHTSRRSC